MTAGAGPGWPALLRSRRVTLRALRSAEPAPDWLPEAERAVLGAPPGCRLRDRIDAGDAVYWIRMPGQRGAAAIGALAAREESGALLWTWLAVGAERRHFGYGGAAVPLLERAAHRAGMRRGRVLVAARNGVALYFWLRLGYRPRPDARWPKPCAGTWMEREQL